MREREDTKKEGEREARTLLLGSLLAMSANKKWTPQGKSGRRGRRGWREGGRECGWMDP